MSWAWVIWVAFALAFQAGAIAMAYEAIAVAQGKVPTISRIMAYTFATIGPNWEDIAMVGIICLLAGILLTHFLNWKP